MQEYTILITGYSPTKRRLFTASIVIKAESSRMAILQASNIDEDYFVWENVKTKHSHYDNTIKAIKYEVIKA